MGARHRADSPDSIGGQWAAASQSAPELFLAVSAGSFDVDDRGFDANGWHTITGTRFDEYGNDQAGWPSDEARARTRPREQEPERGGIPRIVSSGLPTVTDQFVTDMNPLGIHIYDSSGTFFVGDRYGRFSQYPNAQAAETAATAKIGAELR